MGKHAKGFYMEKIINEIYTIFIPNSSTLWRKKMTNLQIKDDIKNLWNNKDYNNYLSKYEKQTGINRFGKDRKIEVNDNYVFYHDEARGYDCFGLIQRYEGCSFPDAVKKAGELVGYSQDIDYSSSYKIKKENNKKETELKKAKEQYSIKLHKENIKNWNDGLNSEDAKRIFILRRVPLSVLKNTALLDHFGYVADDFIINIPNSDNSFNVKGFFVFFSPDYKTTKFMRFDSKTGHRAKTNFDIITINGNYHFGGFYSGQDEFFVEGEFDCILLTACGLRAFAWKDKVKPTITNRIHLLYDNDEAGTKYTNIVINDNNIKSIFDDRELFNTYSNNKLILDKDQNNKYQYNDIGEFVENNNIDSLNEIMNTIISKRKNSNIVSKENIKNIIYQLDLIEYNQMTEEQKSDYLISIIKPVGLCNGSFVVDYNGAQVRFDAEEILKKIVFIKDNKPKALKAEQRKEILYLLKEIIINLQLPFMFNGVTLPECEDIKASEKWADELYNNYICFTDNDGSKSIDKWMIVKGFILSGDFWKYRKWRIFVNLVGRDTGIGKTTLLCRKLCEGTSIRSKVMSETEHINNFSFCNLFPSDRIQIDDVKQNQFNDYISFLTNVVSDRCFRIEKKGVDPVTYRDACVLIECTGNVEFRANEPTGLTTKKKILVTLNLPRRNAAAMRASVEKTAQNLLEQADKHPGIQRVFQERCIESYQKFIEAGHDIMEFSKQESQDEFNNNLYSYLDLFDCDTNNLYEPKPLSKLFSEKINSNEKYALQFKDNKGNFIISDISKKFFQIIKILSSESIDDFEFKPASLKSDQCEIIIDGKGKDNNNYKILWNKSTYAKSQIKNCIITPYDFSVLSLFVKSLKEPEENLVYHATEEEEIF